MSVDFSKRLRRHNIIGFDVLHGPSEYMMGFLKQARTNRLPHVYVVNSHSLECGNTSRVQFLAEDLNRDSSFPFPVDEFPKYDHANNARIKDTLYNQRSMIEIVNSSIKCSYGSAV